MADYLYELQIRKESGFIVLQHTDSIYEHIENIKEATTYPNGIHTEKISFNLPWKGPLESESKMINYRVVPDDPDCNNPTWVVTRMDQFIDKVSNWIAEGPRGPFQGKIGDKPKIEIECTLDELLLAFARGTTSTGSSTNISTSTSTTSATTTTSADCIIA
jgi:hypothetical protein